MKNKVITGKELKQIVNRLSDTDLVCIGTKGDSLGRYDSQIIGIETRQCGFDANNTYKVIIAQNYNNSGAMKFWR